MDYFPQRIPSYLYIWGGVMVLVVIGAVVFSSLHARKSKRRSVGFLALHPDAAKIFPLTKGAVKTEAITIHLVDGEAPCFFREGGKTGVYAAPGSRVLMAEHTSTRPGMMYKTFSKSTGKQSLTVNVEGNREYQLGYNSKNGEFTFTGV